MHPALEAMPIIAILRGIRPAEVVDIGGALIEAGIRAIEIPLSSPEPLVSVRRLVQVFGAECLCGAGTVVEPEQVDQVGESGASLIVTPNTNPQVIARALRRNLTVIPGFATATEAFAAIAAGAHALKLFPAATYGAAHLCALRAVLPAATRIFPVGGIAAEHIEDWRRAGAYGFGLGSDLYRPGRTPAEVARQAARVVAAFQCSIEAMK